VRRKIPENPEGAIHPWRKTLTKRNCLAHRGQESDWPSAGSESNVPTGIFSSAAPSTRSNYNVATATANHKRAARWGSVMHVRCHCHPPRFVILTPCSIHARSPYQHATRWCRLQLIWADGGYETLGPWVKQTCRWRLEITRRPPDAKGFVVIPRRWEVERTFGWLGRYWRLSKDFEHQVCSSEARVYLASIHRMLRLLDG
jgi:transposase